MRLSSIQDPIELQSLIQKGALVVTPNNRLSDQFIKKSYSYHSKPVIEKPLCLSFNAFLNKIYQIIGFNKPMVHLPVVLSAFQEHQIWESILYQQNTFDVDQGFVHEIQKAYTNCKLWRVDLKDEAFLATDQSRFFSQMAVIFEHKLHELNATTQSALFEHCIQEIDGSEFTQIIWACFNDYNPAQVALQEIFVAKGILQLEYDLIDSSGSVEVYQALDDADESSQMVAWIKQKRKEQHQKIGVVIPDIQKQFKSLNRLLSHHFKPEEVTLSLGEPLKDMTLVSHALTLIALDGRTLDNDTVRILTQTPYIKASKSEFIERSESLQFNALFKEHTIPFHVYLNSIKKRTPKLYELLTKMEALPQKASPREWVFHFKTRLNQMGFPGEYLLDSRNYQIFKRFELLLEEYLQLSFISSVLTRQEAIKALATLANSTIFQVQKPDTPVMVMGMLEASGCEFDCLWISGMDDQCLPEKTKPSPFIPIHLQRLWDMPKTNPMKEFQLATKTIKRFQASSKESVFSYAKLKGETPGLPSPLIKNLSTYEPTTEIYHQPSKIIAYEDNYNIPLQASEAYSGGSAILANQAKCPFKAFAANRLHARSEPALHVGPDAMERGQVIHKIMELIWTKMTCQSDLLSLNELELESIINDAVTRSIHSEIKNRQHSFSDFVRIIEDERLKTLVYACLEWEKKRPPFSVEEIEQEHHITLGGLNFKLRVDRLDKVGDNYWVIDYKTTMPSSKPWQTERPDEPQLLLYAMLNEQIDGLLFLQLKSGQAKAGGILKEPTDLEGLKTIKANESWSDYQERWHEELLKLAEEFKSGHCPPEPKTVSVCQYCDFPALCRVNT